MIVEFYNVPRTVKNARLSIKHHLTMKNAQLSISIKNARLSINDTQHNNIRQAFIIMLSIVLLSVAFFSDMLNVNLLSLIVLSIVYS